MPLPVIPDSLEQVRLSTGVTVGMTDSGGDGPVVVFSHGFLMNHTMFAPQVEALRDAYRVVTYDERAHGEAEPEGRWSYWDMASDVLAILDHLAVKRAVILIDTQAGVEDPEVLPLFEAMTADWEANGPAQGTLDYAATAILGPGADEEAWKQLWASRPNHYAAPAAHPLLTREDITDRLGDIACPTLVIHGEADASIPVDRAQALVDGIPNARPLVLIPGAGHASNLTHPDAATPPIREFLDSLDA